MPTVKISKYDPTKTKPNHGLRFEFHNNLGVRIRTALGYDAGDRVMTTVDVVPGGFCIRRPTSKERGYALGLGGVRGRLTFGFGSDAVPAIAQLTAFGLTEAKFEDDSTLHRILVTMPANPRTLVRKNRPLKQEREAAGEPVPRRHARVVEPVDEINPVMYVLTQVGNKTYELDIPADKLTELLFTYGRR